MDRKEDSYNAIFVTVNQLTNMVYYKPVKNMIDAADLAKIIIDMIIKYHDLPKSSDSD